MSNASYAAEIADIQKRIALRKNSHRSAGELYERAQTLTTQQLKEDNERIARDRKTRPWTPWTSKRGRAPI